MILGIVLNGRPLRGKSGQRKTSTGRQYPDKAWGEQRNAWALDAKCQVLAQIKQMEKTGWHVLPLPLTCPVKLLGVVTYPDKRTADLDGVIGAIGHTLERAGIIANDRQIKAVVFEEAAMTDKNGGGIALTIATQWRRVVG